MEHTLEFKDVKFNICTQFSKELLVTVTDHTYVVYI
jgi:hypothetical protein